ncbi:MAG: FAD-dependent oxidoreductase, partial [Pseudomonadota bacterium]
VLGAGMVGISTAIHLLDRGRSVVLVDRRGPAEETSYGNAGLIQAEAVMPYAFPQDLGVVLGVLSGRRTDARLHWPSLPAIAPWLVSYWRHGRSSAVAKTAEANAPLIARALPEHQALMARAGAEHLAVASGYLRLLRTEAALTAEASAAEKVRARFGIPFTVLDADELARAEPHLSGDLAGAIHQPTPVRVIDPSDLGKAYAALFAAEGGTFAHGDAMTLKEEAAGWTVAAEGGVVRARDAVVCLGPWSADLLRARGRRVPLTVKRGYHMHYAAKRNAVLNHLVVDEANGIVITPNKRGIRLTTGAEFARRDAPPTPVQLRKAEPIARALFPLGERIETTPWMGARPCLPDLLPMIGPVPGKRGLWANFGHHHLGFTLGPATGRLLAEAVCGTSPYTPLTPYRVDR